MTVVIWCVMDFARFGDFVIGGRKVISRIKTTGYFGPSTMRKVKELLEM